jgi:hypothetical protein
MRISDFRKLEQKINGYNFNQSYKNINIIMTVLSYFGNIASIFLAYFFMSKIISSSIENAIAVFISSIIILAGIELLKRDIFDKFSVQYLKEKSLSKAVIPLAITSLLLILSSFYLSINGAHDFSNKSTQIETTKEETLKNFSDSLTVIYDGKISLKENDIKEIKYTLSSKDKEQTDIEAQQPLTRQQRQRVADLKNERGVLRDDIVKVEDEIKNIKAEKDTEIKEKEMELSMKTDSKKTDNSKNSILFVIISTVIELAILIGVYFNQYYKFRSYREFRSKIEKDPNYQKWLLYDQILSVILTDETKVNQKLPSNKAIIEMCKVNDIIVLPKDVQNFLKVITGLNIIKSSGSARYISKQKDIADELLKNHFNID